VKEKQIPSSSQTVGPYFRIGLEYLIDLMAELDGALKSEIEIRGRVVDSDGAPVPDAMLEFWSTGHSHEGADTRGIPIGFRRVGTDENGNFAARIAKPVASSLEDGRMQAPHAMVLVFSRGLQRNLITRVYPEGGPGYEGDPVLLLVPEERRGTLVAKRDGENVYRWDVILQGTNETVFFAW